MLQSKNYRTFCLSLLLRLSLLLCTIVTTPEIHMQIFSSNYFRVDLFNLKKIAGSCFLKIGFLLCFLFKSICGKYVWFSFSRSSVTVSVQHARKGGRSCSRTCRSANYCTFLVPAYYSVRINPRAWRPRTGERASNEKQIKFGGHVNAITRAGSWQKYQSHV